MHNMIESAIGARGRRDMFTIDLARTASPQEIAWTTVGLLALIVNAGLTLNARRDYRALIRLGRNGALKIAAKTAVIVQAGLTLPQVIAVFIGVVAMLTPPAVPTVPLTRTGIVVTLGLIGIEVVLVGVGLYTQIRRLKLLAYLNRTEQTAETTRHEETMTELVHNTEVSTEARDGALESFHAADNLNEKILNVQQEIAETNRVAGAASEHLHDYMQQLESERKERQS